MIRRSLCVFAFLFAFVVLHQDRVALAIEVAATAGALHLPDSSYHYLGYGAYVKFGQSNIKFRLDVGSTVPHVTMGFRQLIWHSSISIEWEKNRNQFLNPYFGVGLGVFADQVNSMFGWVPSLVLRGGLKVGGANFGLDFALTNYIGIYSASQLLYWTVWPLVNAMGGIYVGF